MNKILLLIVLFALTAWSGPPLKSPLAGTWTTLDGGKVELFLDNRLVLVDFWASWCVACRYAVPNLMNLQKKYPQLRLVGVNVDEPSSMQQAHKFIQITGMNYQSILDIPEKISGPLAIERLPTLILFSTQGKELWRSIGEPENLELELKKYLSK